MTISIIIIIIIINQLFPLQYQLNISLTCLGSCSRSASGSLLARRGGGLHLICLFLLCRGCGRFSTPAPSSRRRWSPLGCFGSSSRTSAALSASLPALGWGFSFFGTGALASRLRASPSFSGLFIFVILFIEFIQVVIFKLVRRTGFFHFIARRGGVWKQQASFNKTIKKNFWNNISSNNLLPKCDKK